MRRSLLLPLVAVLLTACESGQELAPIPTTSTTRPTSATSSAVSTITTAAITSTTTTTLPPTTTTLPEPTGLAYEEVARIEFPIDLVPWREGDLLATKDGRIWLLEDGRTSEAPVLDITPQVRNQGERGFLAMAVDPRDAGRMFAHYSANDGDTVVSEFRWRNGGWVDERVILRVNQPAGNHNGGMIQFGPDGRLYLGLGDGGGANDTFGNGQNRETLLGGLVAIDVDTGEAVLFSYGLRNPWRFWIDGDLIYVADVGQGSFEEVSVGPLAANTNYGWPITEGLHCFAPSSGCDTTGVTMPVIEIEHGDAGTCSITGGIVYRGSLIPEIQGEYFYSDYCGGYLRSLRFEDGDVVAETDWTDDTGVPGQVTSFGMDSSGEMYVLTTDEVLRVVAERGE